MKFTIEIDCDNAAFQNGQLVDELHFILHRIINDLPNDISADATEFSRNLRDTNGDHVGTVELTAGEAKGEAEVEPEVQAPRSVEFILCDDDNTWSTEIKEVPAGEDPQSWANATNVDARVLFIGVFNEDIEAFARPPETVVATEENDYILCAKCQESTHYEDALYVDAKFICQTCWHNDQ
tara:strand:- start:748 stop:1290 length:543 start_codon:yes stop_codon:yes gene_type:complete